MTQGAEGRGVAYDFWLRVRTEQASRGWTDDQLRAKSGIARTTIDRLKTGRRTPLARVVNALAQALDIPQGEAHRLAGRLPDPIANQPSVDVDPRISVREAIIADPIYTDEQRAAMLQLVDIFEQANRRQD